MRRLKYVVAAAVVWVLVGAWPGELTAQSIWLEPHGERVVYLEILRPSFSDGDEVAFPTSAWYLATRIPVSDKVALVGELPFSYAKVEYELLDESQSGTTIGNIYAGLEFGGGESNVMGEFGIRVPLASDEGDGALASQLGLLGDFVDRAEAFTPDILSIHGAVNYRVLPVNGLGVRLRLAPILWVDTEGNGGDTVELWALYSAQFWYNGEKFAVGGGFSGRAWLSEDLDNLGDRTLHELGLMGSVNLGQFQPGAQLRVPLDEDLKDVLDLALVLSLGYRL
jgi:hypothetical protein